MSIRKTIFATGEVYHVYNRSVREMPIFKNKIDFRIFLEAISYYQLSRPPVKFSMYRIQKDKYHLETKEKLVTIVNFCLMTTHFHFTLRQEDEDGIKRFIQLISNSFAHYYNLKYKTRGPVFEGNFRAVRIEDEEQLLHLSRYIHLNPVTAYIVKKPEEYPYSSYLDYLGRKTYDFVDPALVMTDTHPQSYEKFVLDQIDYQRKLDYIKHLTLE